MDTGFKRFERTIRWPSGHTQHMVLELGYPSWRELKERNENVYNEIRYGNSEEGSPLFPPLCAFIKLANEQGDHEWRFTEPCEEHKTYEHKVGALVIRFDTAILDTDDAEWPTVEAVKGEPRLTHKPNNA